MHVIWESYSPGAVDSKSIKGADHHSAVGTHRGYPAGCLREILKNVTFEELNDLWDYFNGSPKHWEEQQQLTLQLIKFQIILAPSPPLLLNKMDGGKKPCQKWPRRGKTRRDGRGNFPEGKMAKRIFAGKKMVCPPQC